VWFDWGTRLLAILALLTIVAGLLILSLPEAMEGQEVVSLNKTHSLRVADLLGAALVGLGALAAWATVLAWQRKRLQQ
jgi:drug/metabolite transporter (DMT)-like permease